MSRSHATSTRRTDYATVPEEAAGLLDRAVCHLLGFDTTDMSGGGFDGFSFQSGGVAFFLNAG
jgi:hypothetical protein